MEQPRPTAAPRKKSPIGILVGGLVVLAICVVLGGVVLMQDGNMPNISGLLATDTPLPTSTPLPVPTATLRPNPTATSQPDWVIDFSDPIISLIQTRNPDFEDSFSDSNWSHEQWWMEKGVAIEDGLARITADGDHVWQGIGGPVNAVDFVLKLEFTPREASEGLWIGVSFREAENQGFNHFTIAMEQNSEIAWCGFGKNDMEGKPGILAECETQQTGWGRTTKATVIVQGNRAALYLNGQPILFSSNLWPEGNGVSIGITSVSGKSVVEFDNVKFWNLAE